MTTIREIDMPTCTWRLTRLDYPNAPLVASRIPKSRSAGDHYAVDIDDQGGLDIDGCDDASTGRYVPQEVLIALIDDARARKVLP